MAFIRNTDKFVEGASNKFFTDGRAQLALQETVTSLEGEDSGMKLRLDVIEGGAGVEGSIAKAQADAQSYADQQIAALVNSAPEVLDTLKELSDAIGGDQNFAATVSGQIGAVDAKIDQEILDRQGAISSLQSSVSADVSALQSADSALSLRLDQLELDPVTKSYVDSQDSSEQSARQSADSALSGRLDVLEADPTTKTYVDGEVSNLQGQITQEISDRQSAVSSEQSARQSADSALSGRLDTLEADPTTKTYVDSQDSGLQSQIDTEKGRIDAILLSADADKDSFAEIVQLINSVDTENDTAFAGYVSSNDAALAQEVSDRQAGDSALSGRLDVLEADPTTKSYVDGLDSAMDARMGVLENDPRLQFVYSVKSANYTLTLNDYMIGVSNVSGGKTMTLPTAVGNAGRVFMIKEQSGAANSTDKIVIQPQAGELIDGQSNYEITVSYESVGLVSDGSNWFIM